MAVWLWYVCNASWEIIVHLFFKGFYQLSVSLEGVLNFASKRLLLVFCCSGTHY